MTDLKTKKVTIFIGEVVNATVTLRIQDAGPGVPKKIRDKIFLQNFSTKQQSGLGLAHVLKLLQRYGGDIQLVNSSTNQGACFEIKLMVLNHGGTAE